MRKKKTEIAPAPVETDFYREALKAFDVVLPPSEEELEAMRQAEEEKARKRIRRLRAAMLAAVAVTVVTLALWRPWENGSTPPNLGEPVVMMPIADPVKIGFHVYTVPNYWQVSYIPYTGSWELSKSEVEPLLERMEALQWHSTVLLSSLPPSPIGDITITREGQIHTVMFSADGTLLVDGYMARADAALWIDLFALLQKMTIQTDAGLYGTELLDGSMLYLDIRSDGTFGATSGTTMNYSGLWSRVGLLLILYTADPQVGFATFKVGDDGGLSYLENHNFWLLQELKLCQPLYPAASATQNVASMALELSTEFGTHEGTAQLTQAQYQQLTALLEQAQWIGMSTDGYMPTFCGKVTITSKQDQELTQTISLQFTHMGLIYDGLRYCALSDEAWMEFVKILSSAGDMEMNYRSYAKEEEDELLYLMLSPDGTFYCKAPRVVVDGNYLQLGNVVLLAGTDGNRDILYWDRENDTMITRDGKMLEKIPILYG